MNRLAGFDGFGQDMPDTRQSMRTERLNAKAMWLALAVIVPTGLLVKFLVPGPLGQWYNRLGFRVLCGRAGARQGDS